MWKEPPCSPTTGLPYAAINSYTYDRLAEDLKKLYVWDEAYNRYNYIKLAEG